jgi:hypothetical protein
LDSGIFQQLRQFPDGGSQPVGNRIIDPLRLPAMFVRSRLLSFPPIPEKKFKMMVAYDM